MVDLKQMTYRFTFGPNIEVYGYGCLRVAIDNRTNRIVMAYVR